MQIFNFGLLAWVLWHVLHKPLVTLIESRRAQIIEGVANAERAAMALKDSDAKKAAIITQATLEAEAIVASARETAHAREAVLKREAEGKYARMLEAARLKGQEIERTALEKSREQVAQLIVLGVEKALRTPETPSRTPVTNE